jgi:valyl-tRNA synthetase
VDTELIRRLTYGIALTTGDVPKTGAVRSAADFDLSLDVPTGQIEAQRKRVEKEKEQLEKNIANSRRQLSDEVFLSKAPEKIKESIRTKLAEYEAQLAKIMNYDSE